MLSRTFEQVVNTLPLFSYGLYSSRTLFSLYIPPFTLSTLSLSAVCIFSLNQIQPSTARATIPSQDTTRRIEQLFYRPPTKDPSLIEGPLMVQSVPFFPRQSLLK